MALLLLYHKECLINFPFYEVFTKISECILCKFKWVFMVILMGFKHKL